MAQKSGAGPMREVLVAQARAAVDDGMGNEVSGQWTEQCRFNASVEARRGGEQVIADRLQGVVNYVVTARYSALAAAVNTDYRLVDARSGAIYAVRTAIPRPKRDYIDFDVVAGVAE